VKTDSAGQGRPRGDRRKSTAAHRQDARSRRGTTLEVCPRADDRTAWFVGGAAAQGESAGELKADMKRAMRKRYRVILLAAIVAALVVPVGFALSLESGAATQRVEAMSMAPRAYATPTAAIVSVRPAAAPLPVHPADSVPDGAKLFVVGAGLFGLAAVVRRAT
jgi:hypothetical protein